MRFRKKPVEVDAIRLKDATDDEIIEFLGGVAKRNIDFSFNNRSREVYICTLEGRMHAQADDWIIRGVKGELYPCKPDIFAATYEPA